MTTSAIEAADNAIARALASPLASNWIKTALRAALDRDCVDVAADAQALYELLDARAAAICAASSFQRPFKS